MVFAVDYAVRLGIAERRWHYFWHHLIDLAVVALPILRPLRLLRLMMLLRVLNRRAATSLYGRITIYVSGATALLLFCASLAILDAERGHHAANITSFADARWWSSTTMTTVGYGDRYPVTGQGLPRRSRSHDRRHSLARRRHRHHRKLADQPGPRCRRSRPSLTRRDLDHIVAKIDQLHAAIAAHGSTASTDNVDTSTTRNVAAGETTDRA